MALYLTVSRASRLTEEVLLDITICDAFFSPSFVRNIYLPLKYLTHEAPDGTTNACMFS